MERHGVVEDVRNVRRVLIVTLLMNEAVAAAKIVWGYLTGSIGMVSDGLHSLFDGFTNVLGLIGIWVASQPPDPEHPYGHRKFETVFTFIVSGLIFLTCYEILGQVYESFAIGHQSTAGAGSFAVMALTIAANLWVTSYEGKRGRLYKSEILSADALHTKSNVYSSTGVVVGLFFTRLGYPIADSVAGIVVVFFIAKIGYDILKQATGVLVDTVRMDTAEVCNVVYKVEGVRDCHHVRTRGSEHHVYMDLHIQLDQEMTLKRAHEITHEVQDRLRQQFPALADIVVHTEPVGTVPPAGPWPS